MRAFFSQPIGPLELPARLTSRLVTALIFVTAFVAFVPLDPAMPSLGLDPSWRMALNEAVARGFVFGSRIVFTFGPYASLHTNVYHPALGALTFWAGTWLACSYAVCLRSIAPRDAVAVPLLLCCFVALSAAAKDALLISSPILTAVATFVYLHDDKTDRPPRTHGHLLWAVVYSASGLLLLIKGTFVVTCIGAIALNCAFALHRKRWSLAFVSVASPVVVMLVLWVAAGQPITQIGGYLVSSVATAASYTEAMASAGESYGLPGFACAAILLLTATVVRSPAPVDLRLFLALGFTLFLFIAFKGGFVRQDPSHAPWISRPLVFACLALLLVYRSLPLGAATVVGVCLWFVVEHRRDPDPIDSVLQELTQPYRDAWSALEKSVRDPAWRVVAYRDAMARIAAAVPLPTLPGTTDIYSTNQAELLASANTWSPRPVFQSYAAYDPALLGANVAALSGPLAPTNVLFAVEPIDGRLPSLEDGASWPYLLNAYRATAMLDGTLLLRRDDRIPEAHPRVVGKTEHRIGETVPVPSSSEPLYARLAMEPTVLGRLARVLFKTDAFTISVNLEDGRSRAYRLIPRMAGSAFLLSPLVENTDDFAQLFLVFDDLPAKKVVSFLVKPDRPQDHLWQPRFTLTLERYDPASSAEPFLHHASSLAPGRLDEATASEVLERPDRCEGAINFLSVRRAQDDALIAAGALEIRGWLSTPSAGQTALDAALTLTDAEGHPRIAPLRRVFRPDLAGRFSRPEMARSGFAGTIDLTGLSGDQTLGLAAGADSRWVRCGRFDLKLHIDPATSSSR